MTRKFPQARLAAPIGPFPGFMWKLCDKIVFVATGSHNFRLARHSPRGEFFTTSQFSVIVLRHSSAVVLLTDPSRKCSCKRELDGTDCFTFDKFGVGIKAKGFQHVGLHLLGEGIDLVDAEVPGADEIPQLLLSRRSLDNAQNGFRDFLSIAGPEESAALTFAGISLTEPYVVVRAWSAAVTVLPKTGVSQAPGSTITDSIPCEASS
jgi:hypothetical protein